jgi:hypothetical protein
MAAVLIWRYLETVMSVFPRIMLLGVLGAASGSAGFILEHYWSFLIAFFSFAEEALAFGCLPNSWTFFLFLQTSAIFFQQRTAISCSSVRFLFRIVAGFNYFTVERGVCEQRQDVGKHLPARELCCDLKKDGIK